MKKNTANSANPLFVFAAILLALFISATKGLALVPITYEVVGKLDPTADVTRESLAQPWLPYTKTMNVPIEKAQTYSMINMGFGVLPKVDGQIVTLDSIQMTDYPRFSLYHLNNGLLSPVTLPSGVSVLDQPVQRYTNELGFARPSILTTGLFAPNPEILGPINSPNETVTTLVPVANVRAIMATKQRYTWGQIPNLYRPAVGQGYVVRWTIKFIPTYLGVQYPEVTVPVEFTYNVVAEVPQPSFLGRSIGPNGGAMFKFSGSNLEFFWLQYSTDLVTWFDYPYGGEGDSYLGSGQYQWELFDPHFPNDRKYADRLFVRLNWEPRIGFKR